MVIFNRHINENLKEEPKSANNYTFNTYLYKTNIFTKKID